MNYATLTISNKNRKTGDTDPRNYPVELLGSTTLRYRGSLPINRDTVVKVTWGGPCGCMCMHLKVVDYTYIVGPVEGFTLIYTEQVEIPKGVEGTGGVDGTGDMVDVDPQPQPPCLPCTSPKP